MKIELLMWGWFVGGAEIDDVLRAAALGEGAGVFDPGVPRGGKLAVEVDAGLAGEISARSFGWPHQGEHACDGPVF